MKKLNKKLLVKLSIIAAVPTALALAAAATLLKQPDYTPRSTAGKEVSTYLSHELLPSFYNGIQRREPFEMTISQEGVNHILTSLKWPQQHESMVFYLPEVFFTPDKIEVVCPVVLNGIDLLMQLAIEPVLDKEGLLYLNLSALKVGNKNLTLFAETLYSLWPAPSGPSKPLLRALLKNEPLEAVIPTGQGGVRITAISMAEGALRLTFDPGADAAQRAPPGSKSY